MEKVSYPKPVGLIFFEGKVNVTGFKTKVEAVLKALNVSNFVGMYSMVDGWKKTAVGPKEPQGKKERQGERERGREGERERGRERGRTD